MAPARGTRPLVPLACAIAALVAAGCSARPTYPKERLVGSLEALLVEEHLTSTVRLVDETLAVHVDYPRALVQEGGQVGFGPAFDEATRKALPAIHRVLLSTDADIRFYVILLSDPETPGVYLTMVRYFDDIRQLDVHKIDTPEFFARTIWELNYVGEAPVTLEQYVPRGIQLPEFLSWQLARRIQQRLTEELQASGLASVGRCGGNFLDGEFAFTLDVTPTAAGPLDEATIQQVFHASTGVVAEVLSGYQFHAFETVRLTHPATGRNLVLPKTHLDVFR